MMRIKKPSTAAKDLAPPEHHFPSARYFQIHFQYLQEIIGDLRLQMEKANLQIAELQIQLQLSLLAGYRRDDLGLNEQETNAFDALFDMSWKLDVWGRIGASQLASELDAEAVLSDWQAARLSLTARTAQTYIELVEARSQVKVSQQSMRERSVLVELLRGRFRRGLTHALDLRLALTDLANAEAQLAEQRTRTQNVTRDLEVLLGRYPGGRFDETETGENAPARQWAAGSHRHRCNSRFAPESKASGAGAARRRLPE